MTDEADNKKRPYTPLTPESFLFWGGPDTGKSESIRSIALEYIRTKTKGELHVLDTDGSYLYAMAHSEDPELLAKHLKVYDVHDDGFTAPNGEEHDSENLWQAFRLATTVIRKERLKRPTDFIIADLMSAFHDANHENWLEQVYGDDLFKHQEAARKLQVDSGGKQGNYGGLSGMHDWPSIKNSYRKARKILFSNRRVSHIMVAGAKAPFPGADAETLKDTYGCDLVPQGDKWASHDAHTTIRFVKKRESKRMGAPMSRVAITTRVRRPEWPLPDDLDIEDGSWAKQYLRGEMGW